ncbi:MAG: trypsin-like peptidase domain-containing protein [Saprospiraceae bacterium]|nr:trypsin-like peptidase domain-containing protein [Saprospiraceae bacterium]
MHRLYRILPYFLAGAAGGLMTLALLPVYPDGQPASDLPVQLVNVGTGQNAATQDFVQAAALAMPTVVHIKASESDELANKRFRQEQQRNPWGFMDDDFFFGFPQQRQRIQRLEGSGSGVIFSDDGYIVTNNHVVAFADRFTVTLFDKKTYEANLIGTDPKTDLAVLKIDAAGLPVLDFGDSDKAQIGEWVMAVGNPFDLTSTVTAGIISAKGRDIDIIQTKDAIEAFIQTDAAVNPGNSGGALVDIQGALLGINTAIATKTGYYSGYSFAIPINMVRRIAEDIISYGYYQRGKMGLSLVELDGSISKELELPVSQGVIIKELEEGGAAELAGLKPFDVITEANGRPIRSAPDLLEQVGRTKPGDSIVLNVLREGKYSRVSIRMR